MKCKYNINGFCSIASDLACLPLDLMRVGEDACNVCQADKEPMDINQVTVSLAVSQLHRSMQFDVKKHAYLQELVLQKCMGERITLNEPLRLCGVGSIVCRKLSWVHRKEDTCKICEYRIAKMNEWGPDECEERIETILVWLKHSAKKRGIPFFRSAVRLVVLSAIREERRSSCCKKK